MQKKGPIPEHECPKNWEGSSGAMESQGALDMWMDIHEEWGGRVYFEKFLSDDDSTTRTTLSKKEDNKNGCLPNDCHSPTFCADVNDLKIEPILQLKNNFN